MNNLCYIVLDSCRWDSFAAARTPNADRIGPAEMRYSYASWTSPAHYALFMGLTPHDSPKGVFASEVYKADFKKWRKRLDIPDLDFASFVPELSLPHKLGRLGYRTVARVSLPVLNPQTTLAAHFHDYRLMADHNDFAGMVREAAFPPGEPVFYFFNLGETHYPYMLSRDEAPVVHGVHGVFKHLDDSAGDDGPGFFDSETMERYRRAQVRAVEHVDRLLGELFAKAPPDTWFIVTADHGELFGEDNYFGHGPIHHPKVLEVPFLEGKPVGGATA